MIVRGSKRVGFVWKTFFRSRDEQQCFYSINGKHDSYKPHERWNVFRISHVRVLLFGIKGINGRTTVIKEPRRKHGCGHNNLIETAEKSTYYFKYRHLNWETFSFKSIKNVYNLL